MRDKSPSFLFHKDFNTVKKAMNERRKNDPPILKPFNEALSQLKEKQNYCSLLNKGEKCNYILCNMHILLRNNNTHIPESYKEKRTENNY
jgi:hypothetical protein